MAPQPTLQHSSLVGRLKRQETTTVQAGPPFSQLWFGGFREAVQHHGDQLLRLVLLLGQPFRHGRNACRGPRVEILQHGQNLRPQAVAAESGILVGGVDPDGQPLFGADS